MAREKINLRASLKSYPVSTLTFHQEFYFKDLRSGPFDPIFLELNLNSEIYLDLTLPNDDLAIRVVFKITFFDLGICNSGILSCYQNDLADLNEFKTSTSLILYFCGPK